MMNGFGKEDQFADQPRIKVVLDDGREIELRGLAGIMITDDGDYTSILYGYFTLPKLTVVQQLFSDMIETAIDELVSEIQDEIRREAKEIDPTEEIDIQELLDELNELPSIFKVDKSNTKPKPKPKSLGSTKKPKKDPFSMDTWKVDKLEGDEYQPDTENETDMGNGWYFDGNAIYRKDNK